MFKRKVKPIKGWEICPICQSVHVTGSNVEIEGPYAYQQVSCDVCGASWGEEYVAHTRYNIERGDRR